jgi:putative hydrolase of HD superfamily
MSGVQLLGQRIVLRDCAETDLADYREWLQPGHRWQDFDGPYFKRTDDDIETFIKNLREKVLTNQWPTPRTRLVIADRVTNRMIGSVNSYWESKETNWLCAGIGIYNDRLWGQGLGFEAMSLWVDYLFMANPEIVRLDLRTWSGNHGMIALAKRLGFIQEACFRKARIVDGKYYDSLGFGVLREEWMERKRVI